MATKLALLCLGCCALCGCELVANFDRTKITEADAGRVSVGPGKDAGAKHDAGTVDSGKSEEDAGSGHEDAGQ